jgi:hypothetical protein
MCNIVVGEREKRVEEDDDSEDDIEEGHAEDQ